MAKRATQQARSEGQQFANRVRGRTQSDVLGGPGGAFGPTGLAGERQAAQGQQQQEQQAAFGGIQQAQTTGGYDPTQLTGLRQSAQQFTQTGGYDPAALAKITGGYQSFADTGGFTPDQEAAFRRRATSGVPAIYDVLGAQAERERSLTGGLGTGGQISQMARQMAQEQSKAATGAEVDLASQERAGKLAGLSGLTGVAGDVAGARRAGFGQQLGLESGVAQGVGQANQQMSHLFDSSTGQINALGNQILAQYGLSDAADETKLKVLQSLSQAPGVLGNIAQGIGQVGNIATGISGLGAMIP